MNQPQSARRPAEGEGRRKSLTRSWVAAAALVFVGVYSIGHTPGEVSRWLMALARSQYRSGETPQAFETLDAAQRWAPSDEGIANTRIAWHQLQGDRESALREIDALLEAAKDDRNAQMSLLIRRAELLQVMGRHREAIADANQYVEYEKAYNRPVNDRAANLSAFNTRGYFVARAAAENQATDEETGEALLEVASVLVYWHKHRHAHGAGSEYLYDRITYQSQELAYLDTYAYLQLAARDRAGALKNLNRCIGAGESLLELALNASRDSQQYAPMIQLAQGLQSALAVFYHHRSEVYFSIGNRADAQHDFQRAVELGYDKETGNW